ncbi:type IX secretion system membrane protein PorP/SprF [Limibacter armeniacum]|uniref:type IX secretion system membrane protein PorP/SprF n=1 Tax=Limibacter armeniacum TaxID=466084 RepID=UPI002FE68ED9
MLKRLILLSALLFALNSLQLQAQISGYGAMNGFAPLRLSPAWGGVSTDASLSILHRSQSYGADLQRNRTIVSASMPLTEKGSGLLKGGGGLYFMNDAPQDVAGFNIQELGGSFAYMVQLNQYHDLSLGMGVAWSNLKLGGSNFTTGSQWDPIYGFNSELDNGEVWTSVKRNYLSLYGGLLWSSLDENYKEKHRLGVNIYRLNQPKGAGDVTATDMLQMGGSVTASVVFWLRHNLTLTPEILYDYMDGKHTVQSTLWGGAHFRNENPTDPITTGSLQLGLNYVDRGTMGLGFKFDQKVYEIGLFAYYPVTGETSALSNQSTFEVAFRLKKPIAKRRKVKQVWTEKPSRSNATYRVFNQDENDIVSDTNNEQPIIAQQEPKSGSKQKPIRYVLNYQLNETRLIQVSQQQLDYTVKLLNANPDLHIRIVGHSDSQGDEKVKAKVAWERAKEIRDYILASGVDKSRVSTTSKSDKEPLFSNDSEENKAKNRRVELLIYEP